MARKRNETDTAATDAPAEVTYEQAVAEAAAEAAAEAEAAPKTKPVKILPLDPAARYVVTEKGRTYAGRDDKVTNQRPVAETAGTGKEWYGIAAKRPARRQQVMRVLGALDGAWSADDGKAAINEAIADGRIGKGSENATVLLGLCHACGYFEAE